MRAAFARDGRVVIGAAPDPTPSASQVLVEVKATGLNRADVRQRDGEYTHFSSDEILGVEFCGVVRDLGSDAAMLKPGDRVAGLVRTGAFAELVAVESSHCVNLPDDMDWKSGAAFLETFLTAFENLKLRGDLKRNEWCLIHGGGSGVGTAAIQLAKLYEATVGITAGSDENVKRCLDLGADFGINYRTESFLEVCLRETSDRGIDVILDVVGGRYLRDNVRALAIEGRLLCIGVMDGAAGDLDIARLISKRLSVSGSSIRMRDPEAKGELIQSFRGDLMPEIARGALVPVIDSTFDFEEVETAFARMASSEHFGKIVVTF